TPILGYFHTTGSFTVLSDGLSILDATSLTFQDGGTGSSVFGAFWFYGSGTVTFLPGTTIKTLSSFLPPPPATASAGFVALYGCTIEANVNFGSSSVNSAVALGPQSGQTTTVGTPNTIRLLQQWYARACPDGLYTTNVCVAFVLF